MGRFIRDKLSADDVKQRVLYATAVYLVLFLLIVVLSYFFLPEELLKNKNTLHSWQTSGNPFILTLQIFFYNLLSVLVIITGSLFGQKKESESNYLSVGYLALLTMFSINGVVLGTWSFSMAGEAVPLLERITGSLDLVHRAGLWEMMGQLLIACSAARIGIILTSGKTTVKRKIKAIRLTRAEKIVAVAGLALMLAGAVVESVAIIG